MSTIINISLRTSANTCVRQHTFQRRPNHADVHSTGALVKLQHPGAQVSLCFQFLHAGQHLRRKVSVEWGDLDRLHLHEDAVLAPLGPTISICGLASDLGPLAPLAGRLKRATE